MDISNTKITNLNFSGGLSLAHRLKASAIRIPKLEQKLLDKNIICDLDNNRFFGFIIDKTIDIFEKYNLPLPPQIKLYNFGPENEKILGTCNIYNVIDKDQKLQRFACAFNNELFSKSPVFINDFCDFRELDHGSTHFLNIIVHEFLHSAFFKQIQNKYRTKNLQLGDIIKENNKISLDKFKSEISEKIGFYAKKDIFELHAVYWAKEICDSLDKKLIPKYNPFETPKTILSPKLKSFIDAISIADFEKARDLAK